MTWLIPLLLIPTLLFLIAVAFYFKQPKRINPIYGYRTGLSMKNQDTWVVANRLASKYLLFISMGFTVFLTLSLPVIGRIRLIDWFGNFQSLFLTIAVSSTGLVLLPVIITEYKLRQIFTSDGVRK